jgi:hypothetical protein
MKSVNYRPDGGLPQAEGGRAGEREIQAEPPDASRQPPEPEVPKRSDGSNPFAIRSSLAAFQAR